MHRAKGFTNFMFKASSRASRSGDRVEDDVFLRVHRQSQQFLLRQIFRHSNVLGAGATATLATSRPCLLRGSDITVLRKNICSINLVRVTGEILDNCFYE